jgi:putative endonuclease
MKNWCVYILECLDNSYYTGITNDLDKRMLIHKSGKGSKYVKIRGFKQLISYKECKNKSEALKVEYKIKQLPRKEKLEFFQQNIYKDI